ncbi:hypothetical protein J6590_062556 [Homalodisca vitripennis]|nr:hypothetical protein J6590_062556 [Homalodisca vitripennis]
MENLKGTQKYYLSRGRSVLMGTAEDISMHSTAAQIMTWPTQRHNCVANAEAQLKVWLTQHYYATQLIHCGTNDDVANAAAQLTVRLTQRHNCVANAALLCYTADSEANTEAQLIA